MLWLYNIFGLIMFAFSLVLYTFLSTVQQTFEKDRKTGRKAKEKYNLFVSKREKKLC